MRHAKKYWLTAMAERAVEKALQIPEDKNRIVTGTSDRAFIEAVRDEALNDAARALINAELLHRRAVAVMGGEDEDGS